MTETRLLVTSGRGPVECRIAVAKYLDVVTREAGAVGLDVDVALPVRSSSSEPGSAIVLLNGTGSKAFAESWTGSIKWVCPSPVRPHHRRKSWFIGVFEIETTAKHCHQVREQDVRFEAFRAGGPGGQHQNTTDSAVRAIHQPSGLAVVVRDGRSQHRNRTEASRRLQAALDAQAALENQIDRAEQNRLHDQLERGRPSLTFVGEAFRRL